MRILASVILLLLSTHLYAGLHRAPIIIRGSEIRTATRYPVSTYRAYRADKNGDAVAIPFQIDEINKWGDYVMDQLITPEEDGGNGIFDLQDELSFMGDDVGPDIPIKNWGPNRPAVVYKVEISYDQDRSEKLLKDQQATGVIYLGIFFGPPPEAVPGKYVVFDKARGEVVTSRYRYQFDQKNYLAVRSVAMRKKDADSKDPEKSVEENLLDTSTFYLKADLKYFLTVEANHRSVDSKLEAFKSGPIRSIVRVSFFYSFLKLRFELGMYTEVSFFANSVHLPALLYNPIDGTKSLNDGSGFYYGFGLNQNPKDFNLNTNMVPYAKTGLLDWFKNKPPIEPFYWLSLEGKDRMMYVEITPSEAMQKAKNIPYLYIENVSGAELKKRSNVDPAELGESPVNLALYFDLAKFTEGDHQLGFQLYFENDHDDEILNTFKTLRNWKFAVTRI